MTYVASSPSGDIPFEIKMPSGHPRRRCEVIVGGKMVGAAIWDGSGWLAEVEGSRRKQGYPRRIDALRAVAIAGGSEIVGKPPAPLPAPTRTPLRGDGKLLPSHAGAIVEWKGGRAERLVDGRWAIWNPGLAERRVVEHFQAVRLIPRSRWRRLA